MDIVFAIVVGAAVGAAGFVPVFKMATHGRKMLATNSMGSLGLLVFSLLVSTLVMLAAIAICANFARSVLLPFVFALVVGLSATAIIYGVETNKKKQ